jgi:hypothetical protein
MLVVRPLPASWALARTSKFSGMSQQLALARSTMPARRSASKRRTWVSTKASWSPPRTRAEAASSIFR